MLSLLKKIIPCVLPAALCLLAGCQSLTGPRVSGRVQPRPYHVLWITAESLQADHLGCYGYARDTSPFIDAFAKTGVRFAHQVNASAWTSESMVSDFLGMYSTVHGVNTRNKSTPAAWHTPLEILRDAGYTIPKLQGYQSDANYHHLGFTGEPLAMDAATWLTQHDGRPFVLWYHLLDTHLPYHPKDWDRVYWDESKVPNAASRERIRVPETQSVIVTGSVDFVASEDAFGVNALYDGCLRRVDRKFDRILQVLDEKGWRDNTIIIFSADHGEELLEHGFVGHASTSKRANLHDEITHTPLIISFPPGLPCDSVVEAQTSKVDIMPTLFELLGLPPRPYFQGKSLVPLARGSETESHTAFVSTSLQGYKADEPANVQNHKRALVTPDWKLIKTIRPPAAATYELYDRRRDPGEYIDVKQAEAARLKSLQEELQAWENISASWAATHFKQKSSIEPGYYVGPFKRLLKKMGWGPRPVNLSGVASPPGLLRPEAGATLSYASTQGLVDIEWTGAEHVPYLLELQLGQGDYLFESLIKIKGPRCTRLFKEAYWQEFISAYDPARFRVKIDRPGQDWSEWRTVRLK